MSETGGTDRPPPVVIQDVEPIDDAGFAFDNAIIALIAVCLALAAGIAVLIWSAHPDTLRTAENGQVTSVAYRKAAMRAATSGNL